MNTDSNLRSRVHGSVFDICRICKEDLKIEHPTLVSPSLPDIATTIPPPVDILTHQQLSVEKKVEVTSVVKIVNVHLNRAENGVEHNTYCYENMQSNKQNMYLVVRRGNMFSIIVEFSRTFEPVDDKLILTFYIKGCAHPKIGNGTKVIVPVVSKPILVNTTQSWIAYCELISTSGRFLKIYVRPPPTAIVHKWKLIVSSGFETSIYNFLCPGEIYILFNAWCKEDETYIDKEERRIEYIINDTGLVFKGTEQSHDKYVWKYGQFQQNILDCSLILISDIAKIPYSQCHSAVQVAIGMKKALINPRFIENFAFKRISFKKEIIHKKDGSQLALQHFYKYGIPIKNPTQTLKIGIIVTVLRSLGIAARTVTGFRVLLSDDPPSIVDFCYSEAGQNPWVGSDVIKEYAEWAEIYLDRSDVGKEYSGWCYLDVQYGPSPVVAIKTKQNQIPYDTALVNDKMNATIAYWKVLDNGKPFKFIRRSNLRICTKIITKKINSWEEEDISHSYKDMKEISSFIVPFASDPSQSDKRLQRTSFSDYLNIGVSVPYFLNSIDKNSRAFFTFLYNSDFNSVSVDFCPEGFTNEVLIGCPFRATAVLTNKVRERNFTIGIVWQIWSKLPLTKRMNMIKRVAKTLLLNAGNTISEEIVVSFDEYVKNINEMDTFRVLCQAKIIEADYDYFFENDFRVVQPELRIKLVGDLEMYKKAKLEVILANTLPIIIEKPKLVIAECDSDKIVFINLESIKPNEKVLARFTVIPYGIGKYIITAKLIANFIETVTFLDAIVNK